MSLPVVLRRKAQAEFDEAIDWSEQQRAGLGLDLIDRVQDVLDRISANPELNARWWPRIIEWPAQPQIVPGIRGTWPE